MLSVVYAECRYTKNIKCDNQYNDTQHNGTWCSVFVLSVIYAECHYAESHGARARLNLMGLARGQSNEESTSASNRLSCVFSLM
jgi:hypothetical protein